MTYATIDPDEALKIDLRRLMSRRAIGDIEARYLISVYYALQRNRIAISRKSAVLRERSVPSNVLDQYGMSMELIEEELRGGLLRWAKALPAGKWALSIRGVGPVIAATLCAFIRPAFADNPKHAWQYAGLTPGSGKKFNRTLRQAAFYVTEQFVINRGFYRALYDQRKAYEWYNNITGRYAGIASSFPGPFGEGRVNPDKLLGLIAKGRKPVDSRGTIAHVILQPPNPAHAMLTPAHIERRARRWVAKLFFSHFTQVIWEVHFRDRRWPMLDEFERYGHTDIIRPPNWPIHPRWKEPYDAPVLYPELNLEPIIRLFRGKTTQEESVS